MAKTKNEDLTPLEIEALNTESVEKQGLGLFTESKEEVKQEETVNTESVEKQGLGLFTESKEEVKQEETVNTESVEINYPTDNVVSNSNDVKFLVKYPSDYVGKKWFKDGAVITTSKESANKFLNQKIGKVL
jgi:hypothetical protein